MLIHKKALCRVKRKGFDMDKLMPQFEIVRAFVSERTVDLLIGSYAVAGLALLLSVYAIVGRRRLAARLAEAQTTLASLERAEGRRVVRNISQPLRESA